MTIRALVILSVAQLLLCENSFSQERKFKDWWVGLLNGDIGVFAGTTNDSNGVFGQFCLKEANNCYWLMTTDLDCTEGSKYPVLVNSDAGASNQELYCLKVEGKPRYAFSNFDAINETVATSKRISIALPIGNSQFQVSRFSLSGSNDAIEVMLKVAKAMAKQTKSTKDQRM